jgi:hypothetical protein
VGLRVGVGEGNDKYQHAHIQVPGFELARSVFNATTWMRDKHGRIAAIAEVQGVWVE